MIGKFEELTLSALIKAGPDANAAKVFAVLESVLEKVPPFAALYTALDRLAKKGLVSETRDSDDPRKRRLFSITRSGLAAYGEAVNATRSIEALPSAGRAYINV